MKPAPFRYFAPHTLDEALDLLATYGDEGKILAGGQSLIPTMNFRLAQPEILIDINPIAALAFIEPAGDHLRIGAMTRQRAAERSGVVAAQTPLIHATMPHIAHVQIRNRGTIGGSLAHGDPAAELPAVMVALQARLRVCSSTDERWVKAEEFYQGLFTTDLASTEMLVEIAVPAVVPGDGWAVQEVARRHGDYALVGVAAVVKMDEHGRCRQARLVYFSAGEYPVVAVEAALVLEGEIPTAERITEAADVAATIDLDPPADIHATAQYRRFLAKTLGKRTLAAAFGQAGVALAL
jgi:aerobic carbon-monoxide dehydrogenase medium subunit